MNNEKNYLKHFAIIGGGTLINLLLGLFTTPMITRIVDPVEYGQHSVFLLYANLAVLVLVLGMDQGLGRYYYLKNELEYKRALLFRCVRYPFFTTIVIAILVLISSFTGLIKYEFSPVVMVLLCVYTLLEVLLKFGLNINRLEYKSKMYSTLNIVTKIAYVGLALPLLFLFKGNDLIMLCIASAGSAFVVVTVSILFQKEMWNIRVNNDTACTIDRIELMKYAFPLTITMGITYLFQALDRLSIKYFCTYADVGIYTSAISLVNIFAIIQTTFNTVWVPMAMEHYIKEPDNKVIYQKANQMITVIMFFCGASLILCKDVFALLLGEKYREAAYILPFLIFHPIMYTISETTVIGISFMKKSKMTILIAVASCLANFIGNTILVPRIGMQGAAISTGLSYVLFFVLRTVISNHYYYVDYKLKKIAIIIMIISAYALYNTFVKFNWITIAGYVFCVMIIVLLYKDTVIWGMQHSFETAKKILQRE